MAYRSCMNERHALPPWPSDPALFVDLDGTLLEIAARPDAVKPSARLLALLPRLPVATAGAVAVITGRRIEDADELLGDASLPIAGIHGLERRDGCGAVHRPTGVDLPPSVRQYVKCFVERHPGLWLEDKTVSQAIHYRTVPELGPTVRQFAAALQADLPPGIEILSGRRIVEIKPAAMNKGHAIRAFMAEPPFRGKTPVFAGDDVTDEAGFAAISDYAGVSVKVGRGSTAAAWRIRDVDGVLTWLEQLTAGAPA